MHNLLWVLLHGSFDETQKVLLVHAGRCMNVRVDLQNISDRQASPLQPITPRSLLTANLSDEAREERLLSSPYGYCRSLDVALFSALPALSSH